MRKINILPVAAKHVETLSDYGENGRSWGDHALFFVAPLAAGGILILMGFGYRTDAVNAFLTAFSIFTGLLLNVLVLVFTLAAANTPLNVDLKLRREILRQVFVNICFAVIVSVSVVCTALVALSYMRSVSGATTGRIATLILTACTINFTMTLLMIIKRMYFLLDKELERTPLRRSA